MYFAKDRFMSTAAKSTVELNSIGLQNFQTIRSYQEIPLGKLTFIYGPNSAGKSALIDAIEILRGIWGGNDKQPDAKNPFSHVDGVSEKFRRSIRRESNDRFSKDEVRISCEVSTSGGAILKREDFEDEKPLNRMGLNKYFSGKDLVRIRGEIRTGRYEGGYIDNLIISLDQMPLLQLVDSGFSINLQHPFLSESKLFQRDSRFGVRKALDQVGKSGDFIRMNDGWLVYHLSAHCETTRTISLDDNYLFYIEDYIEYLEDPTDIAFDDVYEGFISLGNAYNTLINFLSKIIFEGLNIERIYGSRKTPTRNDLTYLVRLGTKDLHYETELRETSLRLGLQMNGDPRYEDLAREAAFRSVQNIAKNRISEDAIQDNLRYLERFTKTSVLDQVNEALRDHLLLDRSYQLIGTTHFLVLPNDALNEKGLASASEFSIYNPVLVQLELIDPAGNRFSFEEVGSGVGYMLPVLIGIYSSNLSVIEQPELHLHPALQGALGDVFIEACNMGHRILVESHSENTMLRALRRIRDTTADRLKTPSLALNPSEICILYFEPLVTGETKVKKIRVDRHGELLDQWPGGFFSERDKDLFNE